MKEISIRNEEVMSSGGSQMLIFSLLCPYDGSEKTLSGICVLSRLIMEILLVLVGDFKWFEYATSLGTFIST